MKNLGRASRAGYSLVEVTLALLVVAIGLTATFALFPDGMKAARDAVDDTQVSLFADYVFSTLAVTVAARGMSADNPNATDADRYASRVLAETAGDGVLLDSGEKLSKFYWVARNMDLGTGDWDLSSKAKYASSIFTYRLRWEKKKNGNNRDTYFAVLRVWPGEWSNIDEAKFPPRIFYREIIPYPDI
ncbi:MAG: hypothetical protein GX803_04250 [Lentisphaerae bacterium]|jgi:hypothetical protein|nr:hypothetical protein [Lentisphaerota bacterium]